MQQSLEELLLKLKKLDISIKIVDENLKITVPEDFDNPDVILELKNKKSLIIDYLNNSRKSNRTTAQIPKAIDKEYYPLASSQLRLFLLNQIDKSSLAYNQTGVLKIDGAVSYEKLTHVFKSLIERHECFRTSFSLDQYNKPHLKVMTDVHFEIEHLIMESDMESLIHKFIRTFDLKNPPLLRVGVVQVNDTHFILLDMHHIASDGMSLQILMKEFSQLYRGNKLPALKRQYKDYSEWLSSNEYQISVQSQKEFWIREFAIDYSPLELPYDFPRPKEKTFEGRVAKFNMSDKERLALNEISKKYNTTLYSILLGVYGILLSKLSGNADIVIGTLVAGRKHDDLEGIVGMFAKTLALPISLNDDSGFNIYIQQLHERLLNCLDNDDYPYEELINDLRIERDRSRNPLFDCLFVLQNIRQESFEIEDTNIERFQFESTTAKFDLTLEATEDAAGLSFDLEYSTDLFTAATIERFIGFYKVLLQQVIENQEISLSGLSLLSKSEGNDIIKLNNVEEISYPKDCTVVDLFERQVQKSPDSIAVVYEGDSLTYAELNNLSNILANELRSKGIGRDDIVGLFTDKNLYTVVGMLGILKSGGCYLPLDPSYPEGRINYMLEDSKITILVTDAKHEATLANNIRKILLEDITGAAQEVPDPARINAPADLCYIIYTSGTTGNPKGVMIEHENVVRLLYNDGFQFDFGENDVWTMFHSHCFDFSVWEMYGALLYGGKVIVIPQSVARDPAQYIQVLKQHKVTVLNQTPTSFNNLIEEIGRKDVELKDLRYVIFGGEALVPSKLKSWQQQYPDVLLVNMYGITEVTVHATYKEIGKKEIDDNICDIGKPIPTTSLYVLDKNKKLVPQGITGEIYVGGAGISRGYLNNEALTRTRFFDNPYRKGERFYRSGDLGRLLENGDLEYLGRIDDQVQLKGFRIELKEIEHQLLRHESISNALVIKRDSEDGHPYLCAYYIADEILEISVLRSHLGEHLPNYMIPSYFIKMDEFPSTVNNKIAISKLPAPDKELSAGSYVAPSTDEESLMAKIWEEVLGMKPIGIRDNYFSLGGDSLKAIGLIFNINNELHTSLTIADLYSYQTIEDLAVRVTDSKKDEESERIFEAARQELQLFQETYKREYNFLDSYAQVYPMNGVEKGMVFLSLKAKARNIHEIVYHEQNIYDCPVKDFDFGLFKNAVDLMIAKHTTLRKVYDLEHFAHIIMKEADPEVNFIDIRHLDKKDQELFVENKLLEEKMRMTNLSFSLLWRINMIKVRDDFQYLLFDFHHSLFDGWSLSSFLTELLNIYSILSKDKAFVPQPLQSTYEDQIIGELAAAKREASIQYWKEELDGYTRFELPSTGAAHEFRKEWSDFGKDFRIELEQVALQYNTSFKHLCFAAYIYTLNMLSYEDDITVGVVTNNRPLTPDGDRILGCFLNTIPFRAKIAEGLTWGGYIDYIENKLRKLKYHEKVPFYKILELTDEPSGQNNPVFDVAFNYTDFRIYEEIEEVESLIKPEEFKASGFYLNNNTSIDFHIYADNNDFHLTLTHSAAVFNEEQIGKLAGYFKSVLNQFVNNADKTLDKNSILPEADKAKLLEATSLIDIAYPKDCTIVDLFERQVKNRPDSIAVVYEGDSLTYAELNNLSNILANELRSKGIGRDDIVGLFTDKNLYTIVGMLGILKSGGCYLPLDPSYPEGRINYMLEDSKITILVTDTKHETALANTIQKILLEDITGAAQEVPDPARINAPADLCYIIYTSGTTGNPKGVMIEHENVVRLLCNDAFQYNFGENDVWTMFHSHCFDVSVWEMYGALFYGGKVVIIPQSVARDPAQYIEVLKQHKVTVLNQTPTAFNSLMEEIGRKDVELRDLRYVIFAGEALTPLKLKSWQQQYPDVILVNMYGITEVTVHTTYKEIGKKEIDENISVIGKPIPTTSLYILDKNKKLVPQGITGEIYVGGVGIGRGYLNNEVLTKSRFSENPYREGGRFYRSGDLGRLLENGELEYLGRIDNQVQLKGFRIELREIEHQLLRYESISNALVIKRDSEDGHPYLCAYYIADEALEVSVLRSHLGEHLPAYMIPSYFIKMEEFPSTVNNKIAISKLPAPDKELSGGNYVAPVTEDESLMSQIWEEVLGMKPIGIRDNYFSLGGDSLKAIGLIFNINNKLNTSLTIADLYSYQTVEELTLRVLDSKKDEESERIFEAARQELQLFQETYKLEHNFLDSYEQVYPMNGVEKGMVFEYLKTTPENIHEIIYHEQNMYDYPAKDFDFGLFENAMDLMIAKHTTLRKVYDLDCFAHVIMKEIDPEINFIDIRHLDKKDQELFIANKMLEEKMRMTSMSFSLLWRINIIKIRDDFQYLLFDFHHSLFDGWSLSSFLTELLNMYTILSKDRTFVPQRLQSTYEDQIVGELAAAKHEASIQYWKEELDGYTRFELPSTGATHEFITDVFELGLAYRNELEEVASRYNTSFKHLCFAAYIYTLNMLSYEDDITVGVVTNNRPLTPDGEKLLGCFLNTIPFRAKIPEGLTWGGYIDFIENKLRKLKYHERVPFYKILELTEEPSGQNNPVFDVVFNYLDFKIFEERDDYDATIDLEEDSMSEFYLNEHFPIGFHIEAHELKQGRGSVYNKSFRLLLRYSKAIFSEKQTKRMADHFKAILDQFLHHEAELVAKETITLIEHEDYALLREFNATDVTYESAKTVLDLFSEQVHRTPENIAAVFEDKKLNYSELDHISNQLSHLLIEKGVVSDSLVPICLDQSIEMIIGILGILKAGGAYVPIDPKYPQNRINYVLEDTKPVVVLTSSNYQHLFNDIAAVNLDDTSIYEQWPASSANVSIPEESLAYVIYTSGTTGIPKGVMNQHDGIYNRLLWMRSYLNVTTADVILQKTTFCFDVSVWELLLPLITGSRMVFIIPEGNKDPAYLWNLICTENISITHFVPSMLSAFLSTFKAAESNSLRAVVASGEELKLAVVKDFKAIFPDVKLYNLYGPTEAAIDVTAVELSAYEARVTIGKPVANTQIYFVDNKNNIQATGVCGELLIGGVQVSRGYLNKSELTSQKFIDNPFDKNDKYKLYKTGDIGRWLSDGSIELLGRIDDQIKIRGFRVELGEIQNQLLNYPGISESIVLYQQSKGNHFLVGYYVSKFELSALELQNHLRKYLPDYMVPSAYLRLDVLPLTANGKVNKANLPLPELLAEREFIAPSNDLEETLAAIWSEVLGLEKEKISVNSSFFDLGGHSLLAVLLVNKINQVFDMNISFRTFFKDPYIQGVASYIASVKVESINEV
jgi:tyrocidine synthetase-3